MSLGSNVIAPSHKVPVMTGNFGLIDVDTPKDAYTTFSWNDPSEKLTLVFSDEFETDGRSFYPGDDPYWEAVDLHYWVFAGSSTVVAELLMVIVFACRKQTTWNGMIQKPSRRKMAPSSSLSPKRRLMG